jgi:hypothetical protein
MNMDRKVSLALVMLEHGQRVATIARKLRMSEKTIRKYRDEKKLPSQMERPARDYRTRHYCMLIMSGALDCSVPARSSGRPGVGCLRFLFRET